MLDVERTLSLSTRSVPFANNLNFMTIRFSLFLVLFFCQPWSLDAQNPLIASVLDFEQKRFDAMTRADTAFLSPMLGNDLVYIHSNALEEDKQEHLGAIASRNLVYKTMNREQAVVRIFGKTAVINGVVSVQGILKGNDFAVRLLYTAVYRKKGRSWLLVNWQSTKIP
ncbi:MAG TPA: nuclear transport factor 2 family protein [Saprospirales bacterium]|nr:nuclear transport factor 2 family protein [Saprospirales bacterium]